MFHVKAIVPIVVVDDVEVFGDIVHGRLEVALVGVPHYWTGLSKVYCCKQWTLNGIGCTGHVETII